MGCFLKGITSTEKTLKGITSTEKTITSTDKTPSQCCCVFEVDAQLVKGERKIPNCHSS